MLQDDVVDFNLLLEKANSESDPVFLKFRLALSDSFSHLNSVDFIFWPYGEVQTWASAVRVPGTNNFEVDLELSPFARSGLYEIRKVQLADASGNLIDLTSEQITAAGFQSTADFSNPFGDQTDPTLDAISITDPIFGNDGMITVDVKINASDAGAGLGDTAHVELVGPGGKSYFASANLSINGGEGTFSFTLPKHAASGFYAINTVRLYDNALNAVLNYDPADHDGVSGFVLANPNSDGQAPVLERINVTGFFDSVSGRPTLSYDIKWSDSGSGVSDSYLRVYLPGGGQNDRWLSVENGISTGTISLLSPSPEGIYRLSPFATDAAGNRSEWYSADALNAMGFEGDIHVFAPSEIDYAGATVSGDDSGAILFGLDLNDALLGGLGNDQLLSGEGSDILEAGAGNDVVDAGAGDDLIIGGNGAGDDMYLGGLGVDTVRYTSAPNGVAVDLTAGLASGEEIGFDTLSGIENVIGGPGNDTIIGDAAANVLEAKGGDDSLMGMGGDDALYGDAGTDSLFGGEGADRLTGGAGRDTLTGGDGQDTFRGTAADLNGDTITDFSGADSILFDDASLASFTFSVSGNTLTYSGGSLTIGSPLAGKIVARTADSGGVILAINRVESDFDGDGRSDVLWRNVNGAVTDWLGTARGGFDGNFENANLALSQEWRVAGIGDFNGDGRDDVLWRHANGTVTDWLGQANGGFAGNFDNANLALGTDWQVAGTGDFNGDGRDDILWRNTNGTVTDWLGTANGGFIGNFANANLALTNEWQIAGTGDFNGDGRGDVLWRHANGTVTDWLGQANGGFGGNFANANLALTNEWQIAGTGDFNGDGRDDILWRHANGTVTDWLGQANGGFVGNFTNANLALTNDWQIAATGDYDGDGRDDILWRHSNGTVTDWLGQDDGGFAGNFANADLALTNDWQVQPQDYLLS